MSKNNLGMYLWMTKTSKRVGGPVNFLALVATFGALSYELARIAYGKGKNYIHDFCKENKHWGTESSEIKQYKIKKDYIFDNQLSFKKGDSIIILDEDGDALMIEKIGDNNNPYFISREVFATIADL